MTVTIASSAPVPRAFSSHTPKWQRFQTVINQPSQKVAAASSEGTHPYMQQYSHVYHQRLAMLGPSCWKSVDGTARKVERVLDLIEGTLCVVVGTVVRERGDDKTTLHPQSQCRAGDVLFLEDESGRVKLRVANKHLYPTGIVAAVEGTVGTDGVLEVAKIYSPALPELLPTAAPSNNENNNSSPPHLLIMSGLHCGDPSVSSLPRDLLLAFLEGRFGTDKASTISHVVLAGGLTSPDPYAVKELDGFCLALASIGIPLDVLPGKDDPTTANWPQRPFHRSLLQKTDQHLGKLLSRTPNPYAAVHANQYVVGTDGTNVVDLCQYVLEEQVSDDDDKMMTDDDDNQKETSYTPISLLESLRQTLQWCHICPTGPDSVPTVPHVTQDPRVIQEHCPSVYFCGNANGFATTLCNQDRTRLICVPKFSETGEAVLVNLETLNVELLRFEE
jgi:DNA polymerase delta subunit 2